MKIKSEQYYQQAAVKLSNFNKKISLPTERDLYLGSYEDLVSAYKRLSKTANKRLLELEIAGVEGSSMAYKRVKGFVAEYGGKIRFKNNRETLSEANIFENLLNLKSFLKNQTSTVVGTEMSILKQYNSLVEKFPMFADMTEDAQESFLQYLGSDTVKRMLDRAGRGTKTSEEIVEFIRGSYEVENDILFEEMEKVFRDYVDGTLRLDELFYEIGEIKEQWRL